MMPGLRLGGPLAPDASRGNSQVFINGRELMVGEVRALQQACRTAVLRGRYWVNAQGVGGVEGGPALFNLAVWPVVGQFRQVEHPHLLRQRRKLQFARVVGLDRHHPMTGRGASTLFC